ncbi:MAG TPA: Ig-like domain-containing protein [Frankiaceae bacterium]|nr:Ig-like domain-containing protein [Frankiaceae bacterium]
MLAFGGVLTAAAEAADPPAFAAQASITPKLYYIGDAAGSVYTFTVKNTGSTNGIGAVEINRPTNGWAITSCPTAPTGWSKTASSTKCRYKSAPTYADDIKPGNAKTFAVKATTAPGDANRTGTWSVVVSRSYHFDNTSLLKAATPYGAGLATRLYTFELTTAVVSDTVRTHGSACPPADKTAILGSVKTIVVCGKNRANTRLTPTAAYSTLAGTMIKTKGTFVSGAVSRNSGVVVLAQWKDTTITDVFGTGKKIVTGVGASANRTSPLRSFTGYSAESQPPVGVADAYSVDEDTQLVKDNLTGVLANDSDPEGDTLSVTNLTQPANGTLTLNTADGSFTYDPDPDFHGVDTFTYTANDTHSDSSVVTVTITVDPVNDAPVGTDDTKSTDEDTSASVDVLDNDSDVDGNALVVSAVDTTGTTGTVTNNGTDVTYDPNGQFESLGTGQTATDTFTYTVSDGNGGTDTQTVTVTITGVNDAPVAVDDPASTDEASSVLIDVDNNDSDDETSFTVTSIDTTGTAGTVTNNNDGTVTYNPNGAWEELGNGEDENDTFTYTITDGQGATDTATVTVDVNGINDAPEADPDAATVGEDSTGATVNVLGNDTDAESQTLTVTSIDTTGTTGTVTNNGTDVTYDPDGQFEHLTTNTATDTFTYTVTDSQGGTDTETVTITIQGSNDAPIAVDDAATTDEASAVMVSVLTNDSDAEGALTVTSIDTTGTSGTVTNNNDGTVTYNPNGAWEELENGEDADDTFTYTVTDGTGATDTATVTVDVNGINDAPVAAPDGPSVGENSTGAVVDVLGNDTDAESQTLTVTGINVAGTTGTVTNNGTDVTYDPNGQFEYLTTGQTATDTFTYTVTDSQGATDTETVTVTIQGANDSPVAVDDGYSTDEATQIGPLSVLTNDTDAEGAVTILSIDTTGTAGQVTNNNDGTVTYNPNGAFEDLENGEDRDDTFTYTIKDGNDVTDTATVTIDVNGINDAPVAAPDGPSIGEDSTGATVNVLGNDTDAESQTLTVTAVDTTGTTGQVTNNGTDVTYDPNGQFEFLGTGQTATDTFTYTVTDSQGGTDTETVTVTVTGVNDLPLAVDDTASTDEATQIGPIAVLANDSDAEGALTITGIDTTGTSGQVTNNNDGTVTYNPNGAFEDLANGEDEDDTFTYTVTDSNGATDTATVTIDVNGINDAPVAASDAASAGENSSGVAVNVLGNDTDAEGQTLTVTAVDTTGTSGMVTNNGTDVTYSPNGMFEYLDDTETATDTFTYTVTDSQGGTDTETVTITVNGANDAPVANDDGPFQAIQDSNLTVTAPGVLSNDTDADGEALTAGNASDPANGTVTLNPDGSFSYDPDSGYLGADSFTYDVTDGTATDTATVSITVVPPNDTPTADATSGSGNEDGSGIVVTLTGHDADGDALTFTAGTATNGLVSVPGSVSCDSNIPSLCSASVTYTPNANFFGSDSFTYTVNDGTIDSAPATASITVDPVNDQPSFTKGADQTVNEDSGLQTVTGWATAISAGPANESAQVVTFAASTNNDALFSVLPAVSSTGDLTYTPAVDANGVATVTVQATDDGGIANGGNNQSPTQTFDITVTAVNDVPSFTKGADQTLNEDAGAQSVSNWASAISKGPADESAQTLSFTTSNDNNSLFSVQPGVTPTGTLSYTSAPDAVGTATVTIYLSDDGGTANGGDDTSDSQTFTITVNGVNDQPSFTDDGDQTVLEDAGAQTVNGFVNSTSAGPADESAQTVTVTVTGTTNNALFSSLPAIDSAGTLTYTPAVNANGSATVTAVATDDGGTANGGDDTGANETFVITVTAVNDAPSFTKGADQTLNEDAGAQSVSGWATAISEGPANEAAQDVAFTVTNDNNALFASQPAISPTGTLTYTSTANKYGTATVSVFISDNGGTANGGDDTSDVQTFTITVNAVNDAPVAAAKAFTVQANMKISLGGLLTGATDPNDVNGGSTAQPPVVHTPSFTLGSVTVGAGCIGCTISNVNNANGTFDFDPPAGGTGTYTATYTVVDNGFPAPGATSAAQTITFTVNGPVVWFVDEDAATVGTGRLSEPFQNLSSATTAMGTSTNQRIHVEDGNSTGNVVLQTNSWLISDTITQANFDSVMGITPPAGTIARPSNPGAPQRTLTGSVTLGDNSVARGFNLTPGSGTPGLVGSGADGVTVNTMSITTTNARGVDLQNSHGGTISLTRVTTTGATSGVFLSTVNTSAAGSFTITGTGTADSGGIISTSSGNGIHLDNVTNVSLSRMRVTGGSAHGIYGNNLTTFAIDNSVIVNNGTSIANDHSGIYMTNLLGTSTMATLDVSGSREHNVFVRNSSGTSTLTLSNSNIHDNNATEGSNGVAVISQLGGSAAMTFNATSNTISNNRSSGLLIFGESSQKMTATVSGGTYSGNGVGMDIASNGPGGLGFTVSNGTVTSGAASGAAINVYKGSSSSGTGTNALAGTISGMNITHNNSGIASGIWLHGEGGGEARLAVTNNVVANSGLYGIEASFGNTLGGSQNAQLTITDNVVDTVEAVACPDCGLAAIFAEAGTVTGDTTAMCANIATNDAQNPDGADIRVRSTQNTTFRLPDYVTATNNVPAYLQTRNPAPGTTAASFTAGAGTFTGGAPSTCTAP